MNSQFRRRRTNSNGDQDPNQDVYAYRPPPASGQRYSPERLPTDSLYRGDTEPDMTCRDRTNEFMSAVKSMQSRQVSYLVYIEELPFAFSA